ncbi:MAG: hypothetical protein MMC23_003164 [Stictis urceolatum]|nr:hypothetical protein [Stictis urceolata]
MYFATIFTVVTATLALSASAAPAPWFGNWHWSVPKRNIAINQYNVPLSNGANTLPGYQPEQVKAVTLGRGTQNYTCASSTVSDKPVAIGAVATLFDATKLLPYVPVDQGTKILNALPGIMLNIPRAQLDNSGLPIAGRHYFNAAGSPVFDLTTSSCGMLVASKTAEIPAPKDAEPGQNGAVTWLALDKKGGSHDLSKAYRVNTAGGMAPVNCYGQPSHFEMDYAAQYFF